LWREKIVMFMTSRERKPKRRGGEHKKGPGLKLRISSQKRNDGGGTVLRGQGGRGGGKEKERCTNLYAAERSKSKVKDPSNLERGKPFWLALVWRGKKEGNFSY